MYPIIQGYPIIPTRAAINELYYHGLDLYDVLNILVDGYDCSKQKRSKEIIEKCKDIKQKTVRVVVAKSFNFSLNCEVWVITHVGITSKHKVRK